MKKLSTALFILVILKPCPLSAQKIAHSIIELEGDFFERPPLALIFKTAYSNKPIISLSVHLKPKDAVKEANKIDEVVARIEEEFKTDSVIILGDTNLSCSYASFIQLSFLDLRRDTRFKWQIDDNADTNKSKTRCAYDRIITKGLPNPSSKGVLTSKIRHSDHYPVYIDLEGIKYVSFNLLRFGDKKSKNSGVIKEFSKVFCQGDMIFTQEVMGESLDNIKNLQKGIKAECGKNFSVVASSLEGRSSYKERQVVFYDSSKITLINSVEFSKKTESNRLKSFFEKSLGAKGVKKEPEEELSKNRVNSCPKDVYTTPKGRCYSAKTKVSSAKRLPSSCCNN